MNPVGKIIKVLLALIVSGAIIFGLQGCKKDMPAAGASAVAAAPGERTVEIKVTDDGFQPSPITLTKGQPVLLKVTRTTDATCATDFVLDEHKIHEKLPLNQTVAIRFTPEQTGELKYGCAMDKMISGRFVIQ
jgi:plastocyanin domain-containing protein